MQGSLTPLSVLGPQAEDERQRIRRKFEAGGSAQETLQALCALADKKKTKHIAAISTGRIINKLICMKIADLQYNFQLKFKKQEMPGFANYSNTKAKAPYVCKELWLLLYVRYMPDFNNLGRFI